MAAFTIAFDFCWTGKFTYERGKNLIALHAYFVIIWMFDMSLIDFIKRLRGQKPPEPGMDNGGSRHMLN